MKPKTKVMKIVIAVSLLATLTMAGAPDNVAYGQSLEKLTVRFTWKLKGDVMWVYLSNELPQIEKRAGVKLNMIKVTDFGLSVLGSSMYVSNAFAEQNPETVKKLLRATAKGYRDAMANPKEAAKIMAKHMVVAEQPDVLDAQVEATVASTNAPAGKPIGWQADADWQATLNLLEETGGITDIKPLNAYFSNAYLQ